MAGALCTLGLVLAPPLAAEEPAGPVPVLVVDQEVLWARARIASRMREELRREAEQIAAENRRIERELLAEEEELTRLRARMDPKAFRARARAFDEKVTRLRAEQDAKARALALREQELRRRFAVEAARAVREVARRRGALVVLDRRVTLAADDRADATAEVLAVLDTGLPQPTPSSPDAAPGRSEDGAGDEPGAGEPVPGADRGPDDASAAEDVPAQEGSGATAPAATVPGRDAPSAGEGER